MGEYAEYGAQAIPPTPRGSGPKGRLTSAESRAHRALVAGIEAERHLAEVIRDKLLPNLEAHEKRVQKARRKEFERIANMQAAELRTTRTRRVTKVVNYRDLDEGPVSTVLQCCSNAQDIYSDDEPRRGSRRSAREPAAPSRPVIPGERRSARQRGRAADEESGDEATGSGAGPSAVGTASVSVSPAPEGSGSVSVADSAPPAKKQKGMKGYAWVLETVPVQEGVNGHGEVHADAEGSAGGDAGGKVDGDVNVNGRAEDPIVVDSD